MRLTKINPDYYRGLKLVCCVCGKMYRTDQIRADLDGEWFKAYYCVNCIPEDENDGRTSGEGHG